MTGTVLAWATIVLALVTGGIAYLAWRQLHHARAVTCASLLVQLRETLCSYPVYEDITAKIEQKTLIVNRGQNTQGLDHYLGFFELIKHCMDEKVIDEKRVNRIFGYYILKARYYKPIQDYVQQTSDYWIDFRKLADQMLPLEQQRLRKNREEVISYYTSEP